MSTAQCAARFSLSNCAIIRILNGQIDFAITIFARLVDKLQSDHEVLRSKKLFTDQFVVAIAKNHVHVEDTISFDKSPAGPSPECFRAFLRFEGAQCTKLSLLVAEKSH